MTKRRILLILLAVFAIGVWSCLESPEPHFSKQIQGPVTFSANAAIESVRDKADLRTHGLKNLISEIPGQDEIVLQEDQGRAFAATLDGSIWIIDLKTNQARSFVKPPLMPGGMVAHPKDADVIFFCATRGAKTDIVEPDGPGIYELRISTKAIRKIATRVPKVPAAALPFKSKLGKFYASGQPTLAFAALNETNSRRVEKADDLAVSSDGERIYFTEPYDHEGAILGVSSQSRNEALTLGKNGNLWKIDLKQQVVSLVAHGYSYPDGILLEYAPGVSQETSILINELSQFRLTRLNLSGPKAGIDEIVIEGLPGFPDGMTRDEKGRIWIALVIERSKLVTWLHAHPFWKSLAIRIPQKWQPVSRKTALLVLSPDGKTPLYYGMHDGSLFSNLIVVVPGKSQVYLGVYEKGYWGLNTISYPSGL
jgi:sugar lactone lactonase YvrE